MGGEKEHAQHACGGRGSNPGPTACQARVPAAHHGSCLDKPAFSWVQIGQGDCTTPRAACFGDSLCKILCVRVKDLKKLLLFESSHLCNQLVQHVHFVSVAFKQSQEAGLGACRSLHSTELEIVSSSRQISQVHAKVRDPQGGSFANCCQLCWSVMKTNLWFD